MKKMLWVVSGSCEEGAGGNSTEWYDFQAYPFPSKAEAQKWFDNFGKTHHKDMWIMMDFDHDIYEEEFDTKKKFKFEKWKRENP